MDEAIKIAAVRSLLRERRDRLVDCESQTAEAAAEEVRRLELEVAKLTRFLIVMQGFSE